MLKKIILICFMLSSGLAFADNQELGPIVHRQSRQIHELKTKVTELENAIADLKSKLSQNGLLTNSDSSPSAAVLTSLVGEENTKSILSEDTSNNFFNNASQPNDKAEYELALATLKDGKFEEAEKLFANFIDNHKSSNLQSHATFWYAETFYRRGDFNRAAVNYLQSYKNFPKGAKASDALLKLSYSLASLSKNKEACAILEKLEKEFPERPIVSIKRAQDAKIKFNCK